MQKAIGGKNNASVLWHLRSRSGCIIAEEENNAREVMAICKTIHTLGNMQNQPQSNAEQSEPTQRRATVQNKTKTRESKAEQGKARQSTAQQVANLVITP